jgi:membrane-bound lytic murein transglycosylase B
LPIIFNEVWFFFNGEDVSMSLRRKTSYIALIAYGVALLTIVWNGHTQAAELSTKTEKNETSLNEDFQIWLIALRDEARAAGISDTTLDAALSDIKLAARVIERDRSQFEFTRTFLTYLGRCVTDERIKRGRKLLVEHRILLDKIYAQFHVPPRYIVALWGVETNFGDNLGSFSVIEALVNLAYDRRRSSFFRSQLIDALGIIDNWHISPDTMKGSWAGAMGQIQFMPSTFVSHAIDFTGDGRKDIWHSLPDAFGSAANYLSNIGWRSGKLWGREVLLPDDFDLMLATINTKKTVAAWSALGVRRANGNTLPQVDIEGSIVLPQGHKGPAFLVYDNFRIILEWNRSINYAICVGHLADRLAGLPEIANGKNADHAPLSRFEIKEIQWHLNFLGFEAGSVDGLLGSNTKAAVRAFQTEHSLPADGYPTIGLLSFLRAQLSGLL